MEDEVISTPYGIDVLKEKNENPHYIWAICEVDISRLSENVKRVNITLAESVLFRIDGYAQLNGKPDPD